MKRKLFRAIPVAVLAAAAVAGGVLLWTQPWSGGAPVQEASGSITRFRLCDVTIDLPPEPSDIEVYPAWSPVLTNDYGREQLFLVLRVKESRPVIDSQTGEVVAREQSVVGINPETGQATDEKYLTDADENLLKDALATMRVQPLDPADAPWPYSDATTAAVQRRMVPPNGGVEVRWPDPGSGIHMSSISAGPGLTDVILRTCKSIMRIELQSGTVSLKDVHPDDAAAFETFRAEVAGDAR